MIFAIMKKEIRSYLTSPAAYVFMTLFFLFMSVAFLQNNIFNPYYGPNYNFNSTIGGWFIITLMLIIPLVTMKLIADERKNKTDQLLFTTQLSSKEVVLGKYFAALSLFVVALIISFIYPAMLYSVAKTGIQEWAGAYLGMFLLGSVFLAIGIFATAITESQAVAGVLTSGILIFALILNQIEGLLYKYEFVVKIINYFSIVNKSSEFFYGLIKLSNVIYYVSITAVIIIISILIVEKRRWK